MEVEVVSKGLLISQEMVWEDCQVAWGLSLWFWGSSRRELLEASLWEQAPFQEDLQSFLLEDQGNQEDLDLLLVGRCPPVEGFQ